MEKVKGLQNLAYQLGLEEGNKLIISCSISNQLIIDILHLVFSCILAAREMTRGKFLNILQKSQRNTGRKH